MADIASLSAVVHALPNNHASYLESQEAILTIVTLRSLQSREVKILPACSAAAVFLRKGEPASMEQLKVAFQCLYRQVEKSIPPKRLTTPL